MVENIDEWLPNSKAIEEFYIQRLASGKCNREKLEEEVGVMISGAYKKGRMTQRILWKIAEGISGACISFPAVKRKYRIDRTTGEAYFHP